MENRTAFTIFAILGVLVISSVSYQVIDTGEEKVCRTGNGWEIITDHGIYSEAVCPYSTKPYEYANCRSFRATSSKERYGCNEVVLVPESTHDTTHHGSSASYTCYPGGCEYGSQT